MQYCPHDHVGNSLVQRIRDDTLTKRCLKDARAHILKSANEQIRTGTCNTAVQIRCNGSRNRARRQNPLQSPRQLSRGYFKYAAQSKNTSHEPDDSGDDGIRQDGGVTENHSPEDI